MYHSNSLFILIAVKPNPLLNDSSLQKVVMQILLTRFNGIY